MELLSMSYYEQEFTMMKFVKKNCKRYLLQQSLPVAEKCR